ncbi:ATP-binding cassette domain-containing protein [bacterium]|nr:ATP-binding cassette domain-containing protein [bacterium]
MNYATRVVDLKKIYHLKGETVHALRGITFDVPEGDYVSIMGTSGSGKSTLLNMLGCLDRPSFGQVVLGGKDTSKLNDDELSFLRASRVGFVFQAYNLIQQLTVIENIEVPLFYRGFVTAADHRRARELAKMVGLGDRLGHRPTQLSGGQQQRVAVARSLINNPDYILADEPTGNLDSRTTEEILALFETLNNDGRTIILVTHEDDVSHHAKRAIRLMDGLIQEDRQVEERRSTKGRSSMDTSALNLA